MVLMVLDVSVSDSLSPGPPWVDGADGAKEHGLSDSVPTPALCSLRVCFIDGKIEVQRGSAACARWPAGRGGAGTPARILVLLGYFCPCHSAEAWGVTGCP